jgi:peptidoglycan/LPS O-acetylase OafA/YrhL
MQPTHRYLSNLTPLRGIAAIWVVVFHFQSLVVRFVFPEQTNIVAKGYLMVDLFFIMSGFIICHVYEQSFRAGLKSGNFKRFIVARFARIYPLHFFTLLFLIIYIATTKNWNLINDPKAIPANIFLLHSLGVNKIFTWNVPSWSISAEWWAYMVFPFLVIFIYWKKSFALTVLVLFAVSAYIAILFWIPRHDPFDPTAAMLHNLDTTYDYGFLRGLAGFICGMVLYKIYETGLLNKLFKKDLTAGFLILTTVVCMHFSINDGFYIILFVALVLAFALNDGKLHTLCNIRFAQWLGKISYSIYLSSIFLFMLFFFGYIKLPGVKYAEHSASTDFWTGFGYCVVFLIIHIGISSITYYMIEKPFRKYINARWGKEIMPVYA